MIPLCSQAGTTRNVCLQARLPEIGELEKQIQATNEELADVQYKASQDAAAAAASEKALQEQLEQAKAEVSLRRNAPEQGHIVRSICW